MMVFSYPLSRDFVNGLENAPEAFIGMLEGCNFGKLIVRVGA
jgi:NADPH-dependent curcumin reductase